MLYKVVRVQELFTWGGGKFHHLTLLHPFKKGNQKTLSRGSLARVIFVNLGPTCKKIDKIVMAP